MLESSQNHHPTPVHGKIAKKFGTAALHDTEAFIRKWKPRETVKPENIYTKFNEGLKVMGKCNRIQANRI